MVGDCIAVIGSAGHTVRVLGEVESVDGEGDGRAELLLEPVALGEALEVDHQDLGKPVQGVVLGASPPGLAALAGGHLVPVHDFLLGEGVEAVGEGDLAGPGGDAQAEVPEGLEGHRLVGALGAPEGGLELAHEEIDELRVVSPYITLPGLHGLLADTETAIYLAVDGRGFGQHPVHVLMEPLQQVPGVESTAP